MTWRIATRRSGLAQAQARTVADALTQLTDRPCELVPMATTGDEHPERAIEAFDSKGLFIDRTRESVLSGDCHFVVHSYKDLPTEADAGPDHPVRAPPGRPARRADHPRGAPAGHAAPDPPRHHRHVVGAPPVADRQGPSRHPAAATARQHRHPHGQGARTATSTASCWRSPACCASARTCEGLGAVPLEHGEVLHAPAQGVLGIECREDDDDTIEALTQLDHRETKLCVTAERWLLIGLGGGCTSPIGAHAHVVPGPDGQDRLELLGMLSDPTGTRLERASHQAAMTEPEMLGQTLAATLREAVGDVLEPRHDPDDPGGGAAR